MSIKVERYKFDEAGDYRSFVAACASSLVQHSWEWACIINDLGFFTIDKDNMNTNKVPEIDINKT